MNLKETNEADKKLIVGELEVLGKVNSKSMTAIKRAVDALSNSVSVMGTQVNEYWKDAASDNLISPSEKKILKKEYDQIETVFYGMDDLAEQKGLKRTAQWTAFYNAFQNLKTYLFDKLHLFSIMTTSTKVNAAEFNDKYSTYYENQLLMQTILSQGEANIRVLENLAERGTPGEIAIYKNSMYQYKDGIWERFSTPGYLGALDTIPAATIDDYFLALDNMVYRPLLMVQRKYLSLNGYRLKVNAVSIEAGYIYVFEGTWKKVEDKNDWRYIVALNDMLEYGFTPSPIIDSYIKNEVTETIQEETAEFTPHYIGPYDNIAAITVHGWNKGDWFCWAKETSATWEYSKDQDPVLLETGYVYKYEKQVWKKLDPEDTRYFAENIAALKDITAAKKSENGFFNAVLANVILATEAFIEQLGAKVITLKEGGKFKSENFDEDDEENTPGCLIDTEGNTHLHGDTHIKGQLEVGGQATLTGSFQSKDYEKFKKGWRLPAANESNMPAEVYYLYTRGITNWAKDNNKRKPLELNQEIITGRIKTTGIITQTNNVVDVSTNCQTLYDNVFNFVLDDVIAWGSQIYNMPCRGTLTINQGSSTRYLRPFWIRIDMENSEICFDCEYDGIPVAIDVKTNGTVYWDGKASTSSGINHFVRAYLRLGF